MSDLRAVTVVDGGPYPLIYGGPFEFSQNAYVISPFGPRHSFDAGGFSTGDFHYGMDCWYADIEGAALLSVIDGVVAESGFGSCTTDGLAADGNSIRIRADDGTCVDYFHMQEPSQQAVGQRVSRGDFLGRVGTTGASTAPHLHIAVSGDGEGSVNGWQDPLPLFRAAQSVNDAQSVPAPTPIVEPAKGDDAAPISVRQTLELAYVLGKGANALGGIIVESEAGHSGVLLEGAAEVVKYPPGTLVRRYIIDVPLMPNPAWVGK